MPDQFTYDTPIQRPAQIEGGVVTKELSILDGLYVLARRRWLIVIATLVGIGLAVVVALVTPDEFTSSAVLMRETQQEAQSGSLAALRGLGLNLGESQSGLTIEAYPNVLRSHEVRASLLEASFPLSTGGRITFLEYARNAKPSTIGRRLREMFRPDDATGVSARDALVDTLSVAYTDVQQKAMETMSEMIGVDAEAETGLMTVSVTAQDPVLAASLAGRLVEELRHRVQTLLTQKAREDYEFILERTEEANSELRSARAMLARYDDRNRGLTSPPLLAERDRLRQEVNFATEVFSQYQNELKQAEIEVQRASPVITVLDRPVVPLEPERPRRKVIILIGGLFGLAFGLMAAFAIEGFSVEADTETGQRKSQAIRSVLRPKWLRKSKPPASDHTSSDEGGDDRSAMKP